MTGDTKLYAFEREGMIYGFIHEDTAIAARQLEKTVPILSLCLTAWPVKDRDKMIKLFDLVWI